jgi:hypothetical protein
MTFLIRAVLFLTVAVVAAMAQDASLAGRYQGSLTAPNREVKMDVHLDQNAQKAWIGHITLDPGPSELPLGDIKVTEGTVSFALGGVPNSPTFEGKWDKEAKTIKGTATGPQGQVPFEIKRTGDAKVIVPADSSTLTSDFEGRWEGSIDAGGQTLRLVLTLERDAAGKAKGTMISLDQNNAVIPVSTIAINGSDLVFDVRLVSGSYKGKLNEAKTEITGDWSQMGNTMTLNMKKAAASK